VFEWLSNRLTYNFIEQFIRPMQTDMSHGNGAGEAPKLGNGVPSDRKLKQWRKAMVNCFKANELDHLIEGDGQGDEPVVPALSNNGSNVALVKYWEDKRRVYRTEKPRFLKIVVAGLDGSSLLEAVTNNARWMDNPKILWAEFFERYLEQSYSADIRGWGALMDLELLTVSGPGITEFVTSVEILVADLDIANFAKLEELKKAVLVRRLEADHGDFVYALWRLAHYIVLKASILDIQHSVFDPDSIRWLEYGKVRIMLEYGIRA
jgi:hypothetical protein